MIPKTSTIKRGLDLMNLSSIQRRHERYKIIYVYKIKEGLVPNLPNDPTNPHKSFSLVFKSNRRHGIRCEIPNPILYHNPGFIPRSTSFSLTASNLWNCLPRCINSITNVPVNTFKLHLDKFLKLIPWRTPSELKRSIHRYKHRPPIKLYMAHVSNNQY